MDLTTIFVHVDDFCKLYEKNIAGRAITQFGNIGRKRSCRMTLSEILTILIYYGVCSTDFKTFKAFYERMKGELSSAFPQLLSYERIIELKQEVQLPLIMFLMSKLGQCTGTTFGDSTKLEACNIKRSFNHKTLKSISAKGKSSMGWFYGSKLHLAFNHFGEIISLLLTPGNVADNNHDVLRKLTQNIFGKFFADKGYIIDPVFWEELYEKGVQIIHGLRKNMKAKLMPFVDKILHRKRGSIAETPLSILKERMSFQDTRLRSVYGFICNTVIMLIAYQLRSKKPTIPYAASDTPEYSNDDITKSAVSIAV